MIVAIIKFIFIIGLIGYVIGAGLKVIYNYILDMDIPYWVFVLGERLQISGAILMACITFVAILSVLI